MTIAATKIFLSGIPATGKTTLGELMARQFGFRHVDMEANNGREANRLVTNPRQFFGDLSAYPKVVLTWGIPTWHGAILDEIRTNGFKVVWLEGDHEVSKQLFEVRSPHLDQLEAYRKRMLALSDTRFAAKIEPIVLDPYTPNGQFKDSAVLIDEIISAQG